MRISRIAIAVVTLAIGWIAGASLNGIIVRPARAGTSPTRWEYMCAGAPVGLSERIGPKSAGDLLNKYGAEGWEFILLDSSWNYCFKRPLP